MLSEKIEQKIRAVKKKWDEGLNEKYGGELEINLLDGEYCACAFHDEPKEVDGLWYDNWIEKLAECEPIGTIKDMESVGWACRTLNIEMP